MPEKERLIRISFLAHRNESMTEDEFNQYWTQKHAPLVSDWLAKYGVIKYTQVSIFTSSYISPPSLRPISVCSLQTFFSYYEPSITQPQLFVRKSPQ